MFRTQDIQGLNSTLRLAGYSVIGTNPNDLHAAPEGTGTVLSTRSEHIAVADATSIVLGYAAYFGAGTGEAPNPNPIRVKAVLQKMGASATDQSTPRLPLMFGGKRLGIADGGGVLFSDPLGFDVKANEHFFARSMGASLMPPAPPAPTLTAGSAGFLTPSATYNVCLAYVFDSCESALSTPTQITVGATNPHIVVTVPAPVAGAIGWRVYLSLTNASINSSSNFYPLTGAGLLAFGADYLLTRNVSQVNSPLFRRTSAQIPRGGAVSGVFPEGAGNGEGLSSGDLIDDSTGDVTITTTAPVWGPCVILGRTKTPVKSIASAGDSIDYAVADAGMPFGRGGPVSRLCCNQITLRHVLNAVPKYGYVRLAFAGEQLQQVVQRQIYRVRLQLAALCTNYIDGYGTNDFGTGNRTLAQLQADTIAMALIVTGLGVKYFKRTLLPRTSSTDFYQTASNQTVSAIEARRTGYNDWLRDTTAAGFKAQAIAAGCDARLIGSCIDVCKYIEVNAANVLTTNGGFWKAAVSTPNVSGTVSTGSSTTKVVDSNQNLTVNDYAGMVLRFTSGAAIGQLGNIYYNKANEYGFLSATTSPAVGDTYTIMDTLTGDGLHPAARGNLLMLQAYQEIEGELI
jgi:hypothetical protein